MVKLFKPFISLIRLFRKTGNLRLAYHFLPEVYTPSLKSGVENTKTELRFPAYQKVITRVSLPLFKGHGELLLKFVKAKGVSLSNIEGERQIVDLLCNGHNIRLNVHDYDNLKVVEEVFVDKLYDFSSIQQFVVLDVGMNIGAASLFFASYPNVVKVYGFEPFDETFKMAKANFFLNDPLKDKVEALNFGVGKDDAVISVPVPEGGSLGGSTDPVFIAQTYGAVPVPMQNVTIVNVTKVINDIRVKHPNQKKILKLDCEGAEYEIVEALLKNGLLNEFDIYMIEFHFNGNGFFKDIFSKNGFTVLSPSNDTISEYGMLYAFSNSSL